MIDRYIFADEEEFKKFFETEYHIIKNSEEGLLLQNLATFYRKNLDIAGSSSMLSKKNIPPNLINRAFLLADRVAAVSEFSEDEFWLDMISAQIIMAIAFPDAISPFRVQEILSFAQREDIPNELWEKNKTLYPQHLHEEEEK